MISFACKHKYKIAKGKSKTTITLFPIHNEELEGDTLSNVINSLTDEVLLFSQVLSIRDLFAFS